MVIEEARWLFKELSELPSDSVSPVLNLGSGTGDFRRRVQPWISAELMDPLAARGVEMIHCDLKKGDGVDIVANLLDDHGHRRLRSLRAGTILLSNVLEHVPDRATFCARVAELVGDGAHLVVTVPRSYPYHTDPVDTLFRPRPAEVAALFPELTLVRGEVITAPTDYSRRVKKNLLQPVGDLALLPYLLLRFGSVRMSRLAWLRRPFEQSCCLFVRERQAAVATARVQRAAAGGD